MSTFLDNDKKREALRQALSNFFSLSVLQAANHLLPLLTLPYLTRVLGPEKFGLISFATSFVIYFLILTDFGFNLSATREIAVNKDDPEKVLDIFNSVMVAKLLLLLISFIVMAAVVFVFSKYRKDWIIYFLSFGMVVGQSLFPIWFFQGMQKMKYITVINVGSKLVFTLLIFLVVKDSSDYIYVPLINAIGYILAGVISLFVVFSSFGMSPKLVTLAQVKHQLSHSSEFFLSRASVSIYTSSNIFILGIFTNNTLVGYYAAAEKLYAALQNIYVPLNNALYPYIASSKNIRLYKKIFWLVFSCNTMVSLLVYCFSSVIVNVVFGSGLANSAGILRVFALTSIVVVPSILLGYPFLAALGHAKYANMSVVIGSVFHLIVLMFLIFSSKISIVLVAGTVLLTESVVLAIRLYGVKVNNLWANKPEAGVIVESDKVTA